MKRDPRLRGLSSDHHHLLALARRLERTEPDAWTAAEAAALRERTVSEIEPHFHAEEEGLLLSLRAADNHALADQLTAEHRDLRAALLRAGSGDSSALAGLSEGLVAHVRWEERELFPWCQQHLPAAALDRVALMAPHVDPDAKSPPLAQSYAPNPSALPEETPSEEQISALMSAFYTRVRQDDMLGPVFDDAIGDWPEHLEKLAAFWSRALRGTARYSGNPMAAHRRQLPRITPAHFQRWLGLWEEVTAAELDQPTARRLQEKATRMAQGLQGGLFGGRG